MIGEVDWGGVFIPSALVAAIAAYITALVIRRVFAIIGFYRLVWHAGLFDFALLVLLWGAFAQHFVPGLRLLP